MIGACNQEKKDPQPLPAESAPLTARTLLPPPVASLISLCTATASLSLRIGGFLSTSAINIARVGALTGFDVGRLGLESVLSRAGQDVPLSSTGRIGNVAAEELLGRVVGELVAAIVVEPFH